MNNGDDEQDDEVGWLQGGSLKPGAGGRTIRSGDHIVAPAAGSVTTSASALQYTIASFGYDSRDMRLAMERLDNAHLQAIQDKTLHPVDEGVPRPSGFDDEKYEGVAASFAISIADDRRRAADEQSKSKDRSVSVVTAAIIAIVSLIGGGLGVMVLQKYLEEQPETTQTTEIDQ